MSKKIPLVILAGGKGTRIKKLTNKPKPLSEFNGIAFLQLVLNHYSKFNISKIFIMAGYKAKYFEKYNNQIINSVRIKVINESTPLGTAGSLSLLKNKIKEDFVLINGDTICPINLDQFVTQSKKKIIHIALIKNKNYKSNSKLINLSLDKDKNVLKNSKSKLMNAGIMFIKRNFLNKIKRKFLSLENDFLPDLINDRKVSGTLINNFFLDIGTPSNFQFAKKELKKYFIKKGAFLDRDGVINYDYGYVHDMKNFHLRPGVIKSLKLLIKKNYYLFLVTNQAGIGKNKFSLKKYLKFNHELKKKLSKKSVYFDAVEFCPYHPQAKILKYKKKTNFRKPGNGMILKILDNFYVNKRNSFMIGDKISDQLSAKKTNLKFYFTNENLYKLVKKINL